MGGGGGGQHRGAGFAIGDPHQAKLSPWGGVVKRTPLEGGEATYTTGVCSSKVLHTPIYGP